MDYETAKKIVEGFERMHKGINLDRYEDVCIHSTYEHPHLTDYTYGYLKMFVEREEKLNK